MKAADAPFLGISLLYLSTLNIYPVATDHPNIKVQLGPLMRSVSEVGVQVPCHRLSLISLRCSFIVYITVMPGGLHMRVHPPGKAPDLLCPRIQQNRMAQPSWKQDLGRGHQLGRLLHSTQKGQCQRNMIIQKCGMKPLQRRGAEQSGQVREGAEGLTAEWAESLSVAWRALYSHWDAGGTRH